MIRLVFFSNVTENTARFVKALDLPAQRIPIKGECEPVTEPYVLITPTYGDSTPNSFIPRQVQRFLAAGEHGEHLRAVVASGQSMFGPAEFARAGHLIAARYRVPLLHTFELSGFTRDVTTVRQRLEAL